MNESSTVAVSSTGMHYTSEQNFTSIWTATDYNQSIEIFGLWHFCKLQIHEFHISTRMLYLFYYHVLEQKIAKIKNNFPFENKCLKFKYRLKR